MATKNFKDSELTCKCGCGMLPTEDLQAILQTIRGHCGFPLNVNSAARCKAHNTAVGGTPKSYHVKGLAVDINIRRLSSTQLNRLVHVALVYFPYMKIYTKEKFIHLDLRSGLRKLEIT
jgi:uncharacterized protein YcbK (DUF882 family)